MYPEVSFQLFKGRIKRKQAEHWKERGPRLEEERMKARWKRGSRCVIVGGATPRLETGQRDVVTQSRQQERRQ